MKIVKTYEIEGYVWITYETVLIDKKNMGDFLEHCISMILSARKALMREIKGGETIDMDDNDNN